MKSKKNGIILYMKEILKIDNLRKEVDKIDNIIVKNLLKRLSIVQKIGKLKKNNKLNVVDKKREDIVIKKIQNKAKKFKKEITDIYKSIIKNSRKIQK